MQRNRFLAQLTQNSLTRQLRSGRLIPWLLFCGAAALYGRTSAPSIVTFFDDSLEFQLIGPTLGIAHPTGYPLYTLLLGLWSRLLLPVGNWAWRVNLFSALCGAATVTVVFLAARRLRNWQGGVAAALAIALSPVWWGQTTVAEVYALHNLFVALILYTALTIPSAATPEGAERTQIVYRRLAVLCLLVGLSFTHHRTTLLLLPPLALYLLWLEPALWRPRPVWGVWLAALLIPLLLYLYIPLRAATGVTDLHGSYVNSWGGFWHHVLARGYSGFLQENALAAERSAAAWVELFRQQFGWWGIGLGILGAAGLFQREQRLGWALVLMVFVANGLFAWFYRVPDVEVFLLPAFLCWALLVGGGVGWLVETIAQPKRANAPARLATHVLAPALVLGGLLLGVGGRGPAVDRSHTWDAHDRAVAMAKVDFPPESRVVGLEGEITALRYMQAAERLVPNATGVVADNADRRRAVVEALVQEGYPVYLTRELPGIEARYSFSGEGPLVRVWPMGAAQPEPPLRPLDVPFADGALLLTGADLDVLNEAGGPSLRVAFYWQPQQPLDERYKLSLRVLGTHEELTRADLFPLHQVAYTEQWLPGVTVRDVHTLRLPFAPQNGGESMAQTPLTLQVILYAAESLEEAGRWEVSIPE